MHRNIRPITRRIGTYKVKEAGGEYLYQRMKSRNFEIAKSVVMKEHFFAGMVHDCFAERLTE